MSLWTKSDASAGAPKHPGIAATGNANGASLFGNTQISAFTTGQAVGIFGVDTTEQGVSATSKIHPQHAGWVAVTQGTGPVVSISANTGATSPDGNVYITFTGGGTGNTSANAQIFTNSVSKVITSIVVNTPGKYITSPTMTAVNLVGTLTATMGGRANRKMVETLVATGTIGTAGTADASDDATFPDA